MKYLYFKYAIECCHDFANDTHVHFIDMLEKIQQKTGVELIRNKYNSKYPINYLVVPWIEQIPNLICKFTNIFFEEQLDILKNPDILRYEGSLIL